MSAKYVLDACSVIAYYAKEPGWDVVRKIIDDAIADNAELYMHKVNLFEVFYDAWKTQSEADAISTLTKFRALPVSVIDIFTDELMTEATRFKTTHRISVADAFALGLAKLENAALVTSDHHEFDPIEAAGDATFLWIR